MNTDMPLWQLTVGQFEELLRKCGAVQPHQPPKSPTGGLDEEYLTTKQAAEYLKVSISTIHRWKDIGYLPFLKKGGILRFAKSDLDKLRHLTQPPKSPTGGLN